MRLDLGYVLASGSQTWRAGIVRVGGPAACKEYDEFMRLEQPSRTILVAIVVPSGTVLQEPAAAIQEPAAAKEPEGEPQPQG